jgi:hypothetical protein
MRLGIRDFVATIAIATGLAFALSVTQGWGWPLMTGVRTGIIALGLSGVVACSVSGWASEGSAIFKSPFVIFGSVIGAAALGVGVLGLFVATMPYLVGLMAAMVLLWMVTVTHRSVPKGTNTRPLASA